MADIKLTVAICGGGIAGLVAAISLARLSKGNEDIHIDIYESAHAFSEIGAGIGMFRRPWKVMKVLGLQDALKKIVAVPENEEEPRLTFTLRKSDRTEGISFYQVMGPMGILSFHRAEFFDALSEELDHDSVNTHFSKRLTSYTLPSESSTTSSITLSFKDGTSASCDVLIGSDGINSAVRRTMLELAAKDAEVVGKDGKVNAESFREVIQPVWSGSVAYRGVIPREKLSSLNPNHKAMESSYNYMGKNKHLIVFPIKKGQLINVVAFCSWPDKDGTVFEGKTVEERTQAELLEQYQGWEEEVQQLLQCMEKPSRWVINNLKPLPISVHGPVALTGDACHAMTPHLGSGAGQAIEDAYILASLLAHPGTTRETLHDALKVYEAVRLPHGLMVQRLSRLNGKIYEFADPRFEDIDQEDGTKKTKINEDDMARLNDVGLAAVKNWEWAWTTDIEDDRERAIQILEDQLRGSKR